MKRNVIITKMPGTIEEGAVEEKGVEIVMKVLETLFARCPSSEHQPTKPKKLEMAKLLKSFNK